MQTIEVIERNYLDKLKYSLNWLPLDTLEDVVEIILNSHKNNHQIFVFGNGGSGATASHFACDLSKGLGFRTTCLNDNIPTILAYANDKSYNDIFVEQLKTFLEFNDIVIGISGSGNSKNVIKAIRYANENAALSIALTGFDGGKLAKIAKMSLIVPINDMQIAEDVHLILTHMIMRAIKEIL